MSASRSNHRSGLKEAQKVDRQLRLDVRDSEETHLNSLASGPQISVDRLIAAIPTKQDKTTSNPKIAITSAKRNTQDREIRVCVATYRWSRRFPWARTSTRSALHYRSLGGLIALYNVYNVSTEGRKKRETGPEEQYEVSHLSYRPTTRHRSRPPVTENSRLDNGITSSSTASR